MIPISHPNHGSISPPFLLTYLSFIFSAASAATLPHLTRQEPNGGVKLHSSCNTTTYHGAKAEMAIADASALLTAALVAVSFPDNAPYNYFFAPSSASHVTSILNTLSLSLDESTGLTTHLWCTDYTAGHENICSAEKGGMAISSVPGPDGKDSSIMLCPKALALSKMLEPCKYRFGIYSIGWVLLEGLLRMPPLIGHRLLDGPFKPSECHALLSAHNPKISPTENINSYLLLALWSYQLGLGGNGLGRGASQSNNCVRELEGKFPDRMIVFIDDPEAERKGRETWGVMSRAYGMDYVGLLDKGKPARPIGLPPDVERPS